MGVEALPFVSRVTGGGGGGRRDGVRAAGESKGHVGWCEWRNGPGLLLTHHQLLSACCCCTYGQPYSGEEYFC